MTTETRITIGEGGRGLEVGLVLEDKDASEKLKIQTNSLIAQSDSQSDSPSDSDSLKTECDHDWEFVDDSFDHEFGCEQIHYWVCSICDTQREMEQGDYDYGYE